MLTILPLLLAAAPVGDAVLVRAGTIHLVGDGTVLKDGALLIEDGKIVEVGDLETPPGVREVDYGPDATIVPGFVAADSRYGEGPAAERAAAPMLRATDNFDVYSRYTSALAGGVTTAYLAPADDRLIAGQGGVAKLAGEADMGRFLSDSATIHGSIATAARSTPGFWEPPLPATVDVGLGVEQPQLPRTTMGAVVGLRELMAFAGGDAAQASEWGSLTGPALADLMQAGRPWRMVIDDARQAKALHDLFVEAGQPLILEASAGVVELASELAAAGISVIYEPGGQKPQVAQSFDFGGFRRGGFTPPVASSGSGGDRRTLGDSEDQTTAAVLLQAGVKVAIATPDTMSIGDLLQAAAMARRGGLSAADALRAITLTPAELLGVADRVGSLATGKDADFVVLNGEPTEPGVSVNATWVEGELCWEASERAPRVVQVEELHLGDGTVLTPGEVLIRGGKIVEVGQRVGRPKGAVLLRAASGMPGAIDSWGHLGVGGSRKGFSTRFDLSTIVEPGDADDHAVAAAGVTTVNLAPYSVGYGTPSMAYKPAGDDPGSMVLSNPTGVLLVWDNPIPSLVGNQVRGSLAQAADYAKKWREYEEAMAKWTPPAPEAEEAEAADEEKAKDEDDDKKKKPKDKPEAIPATGTWEAGAVRLRLLESEGVLEGTLRAPASEDLVHLTGSRDGHDLALSGAVGLETIELTLTEEFDENDVERPRLQGTWKLAGAEGEGEALDLPRTGTDYPVVRRPERRKQEEEKEPKGKPRSPGINPDLEPLRQALLGRSPVFVQVSSSSELDACLAAFNQFGLKPILVGNPGVSSRHASRIAGVLMTSVTSSVPAGVPVMFRSDAEQAAADLLDQVAMAVADGLSPSVAVRALTGDAATMLKVHDRVGFLRAGQDADLVLFDGPPLHPASQVVGVLVDGEEITD